MICRKVQHNTYIATIKCIKRMKDKYGGEYASYYCSSCNKYHITSNTKGGKGFLKFIG